MIINSKPIFSINKLDSTLSTNIKLSYNNLTKFVNTIPVKSKIVKKINGTGGLISIGDLMAYQIGWGNLLINWYEAGLKGEMPEMPGEGFKTWDYKKIAQHFYQKYQYDSSKVQEQKFFEVVKKILEIVETEHQTGNLYKTGIWSWCKLRSGKEWPLSKWVNVNSVAPYKRAYQLIRYFMTKI